MTVAEMVEKLLTFDQDARVFAPGCCDDGLDDFQPYDIRTVEVLLDRDNEVGHGGQHDYFDDALTAHRGAKHCPGVVIG